MTSFLGRPGPGDKSQQSLVRNGGRSGGRAASEHYIFERRRNRAIHAGPVNQAANSRRRRHVRQVATA